MAVQYQRLAGDMEQSGENQDQGYYSPRQLRDLLYLYPYLLEGRPPKDDDIAEIMWQNLFGLREGWQTKAARKRAEISRGIRWLNARHEEICYSTRAFYIVGLPTADIANYITRISGRSVHKDTVNDWRRKGFDWLLDYLNGELE